MQPISTIHARGAEYRRSKAGALGDVGCLSFYPCKNLGAYGEAGALVTDDVGCADRARLLRDWGQRSKREHVIRGFNYRMDEIQAAVLLVKLRSLDAWRTRRATRAEAYTRLLADSPVVIPAQREGGRHAWHIYAVKTLNRDHVRSQLRDESIETGVHYRRPIHLQPAFQDLGYAEGAFPEAERAACEVLSLPLYPELSDAELAHVAVALKRAVARDA